MVIVGQLLARMHRHARSVLTGGALACVSLVVALVMRTAFGH